MIRTWGYWQLHILLCVVWNRSDIEWSAAIDYFGVWMADFSVVTSGLWLLCELCYCFISLLLAGLCWSQNIELSNRKFGVSLEFNAWIILLEMIEQKSIRLII